MSKGTISIEDLLKFADAIKQREAKPKRKSPKRTIPGGRYHGGQLPDAEVAKIVAMRGMGIGVHKIARHLGRSKNTLIKLIKANPGKFPLPTPKVEAPPVVVDETGLGMLKRSMERLHDRITALSKDVGAIASRLEQHVAKTHEISKNVDRITREFVNTNPPPPELVTGRNGHAKV